MTEGVIADFSDVKLVSEGSLVERFNIFHINIELDAFQINFVVYHCVKDECVVWAGRETKGKRRHYLINY